MSEQPHSDRQVAEERADFSHVEKSAEVLVNQTAYDFEMPTSMGIDYTPEVITGQATED